jgi:hypothetical protein
MAQEENTEAPTKIGYYQSYERLFSQLRSIVLSSARLLNYSGGKKTGFLQLVFLSSLLPVEQKKKSGSSR